MAAEHLSYNGINRSITDYAGSRACEELINLRPTSEGLMPVRPFTTMFSNKNYDRIFVHHAVGINNLIGVKRASSAVEVTFVSNTGIGTQALFSIPVTGTDEQKAAKMQNIVDGLSFATAGDIILVSVCDKTDGIYGNWSFKWTGVITRYKVNEADIPAMSFYVDDGSAIVNGMGQMRVVDPSVVTRAEITENVESALNALQESDPELCVGPVIIAFAFKTRDGNTFWTDRWFVYDPLGKFGGTYPPTVSSGTTWWGATAYGTHFDNFLNEYGVGYDVQRMDVDTDQSVIILACTKVSVTIGALSPTSGDTNYWNKNTSMLKSVEVYASRPIPYVDPESAYDGMDPFGVPTLLAKKDYGKMDLDSTLLYHQASVPMETLLEGSQTIQLRFGGNIQTTNETLRVDAGAVTRYGKLLSYNARFHYYDSVSKTQVGDPSFSWDHTVSRDNAKTTYHIVRYSDDNQSKMMCVGGWGYMINSAASLVVAPSLNIKEVIVYSKGNGDHWYWKYRMRNSSAYNFSICDEGPYDSGTGTGDISTYEAVLNSGTEVETVEQASINVTEQYNPFVFRVEHSYLAPGRITDLVPQNFVVTDATYGREPLDVFTERGIYAIIQGSGDILYAWFDPIDPMVAFGKAVPTEMGIFFLSGGSLYLCAGHRITLVSDALMAGPHKYVRSAGPNGAYAKIAGSSGLVDMSSFVSAVDFETFAGSGRLSYNRFRQEVYVSNPSYDYTYVLSLKYRQWFKVSQRIWQDEPASIIVSRPGTTAGYIDVLNMETEASGSINVHLQTRPFSMGYQYAHIHRALSMIRAKLSTGDKAILHLYGSDDLQQWTLLAYASRSGSSSGLYISQLRTPTAARSWRYYTICLTGQVPSAGDFQTDVGPFVVDYSAVIRRLG